MAKLLDLKRKVNALVNKSKVSDEGFSYICCLDDHHCQGRKAIIEYLRDKHAAKYNELKTGFDDDKEFQSQLSKLVMSVPYSNKAAKVDKATEEAVVEVEEEEDDSGPANKNYPLTLDFMRKIDDRTTQIPNYGSLAGRIARLLALVLEKQQDGKIFDVKKEVYVEDVYNHLQTEHKQFIENLEVMFPPAKKRMSQFFEKAVENHDLKVPTVKMVEKLQKIESDRVAAEKKKEMEEKLAKAKAAREELERRRKEEEEKRQALKRKKAEEFRLNELKSMKISPNVDRADEILKIKKEICRLEKAIGAKPNNKSRLQEKLSEVQQKMKTLLSEIRVKRINKRMEACLEILSPKQLRKLSMEYFNSIENLDQVSWTQMCQGVKIEDDFEFLADFLGCMYELATLHNKEKKGFKVGHVLVTSKQTEAILSSGIKSIRDNIQESFRYLVLGFQLLFSTMQLNLCRIPDTWEVEAAGSDLGPKWSSVMDSLLLIGGARFGKNLLKIVTNTPELSAVCLDTAGAVKEPVRRRFGHLLNVYINRGKPAAEFGYSLYSVDVDEGEDIIEEEEKKKVDSDEEIVEITELEEDNKENKDENQALNDAEVLGDEDNDKLVDEEIDDKLLDEAD